MMKIFSTKDVHSRDRYAYWHDVACKTIVDHDSWPLERVPFEAQITLGEVGGIRLVELAVSALRVSHMRSHISHARSDELFVCRPLAGNLALEQHGREARLKPGDMALLDPLAPYSGVLSVGSKMLLLKVPRRGLEARVGRTHMLVSRVMKHSEADSNLASSFIAMLPSQAGKISPLAEDVVEHQTLDLLAVSLSRCMQQEMPRVSSAKALALVSVRAAIEARLSDPALDAESVAAAPGISVRYANAALAAEGTSIVRLIREQRLARCRKALEDPLQCHRTLTDIAYGWGFSDMTHFARRFKKAFGISPRDYRVRAKGTAARRRCLPGGGPGRR